MESEGEKDVVDDKQQRTEFAMVVFHNIPETYPSDAHIECGYTITPDLVPTSYDWLGLYKVGWMSTKDYHYYEWAAIPKNYEIGKETSSSVLFPSHKMPGDDGEFYQFCYVTSSGQIRGASTPFQFKKPSADDYVELEDSDTDMLVIRSKTVVLEERVQLLEEEKLRLEQVQEDSEKERNGLVQKLCALDKQLEESQKENQQLEERVQEGENYISQLNQEAHDMNIVREELQARLDTQAHENAEMEGRINRLNEEIQELKAEIRKLQNEKDKFEGEMRVMNGQLEMYKNHFAKSEMSTKENNEKLEVLTSELRKNEDVIQTLRTQSEALQRELQDKEKHLEVQVTHSAEEKHQIDCLTERLKNTEDKLEAAENTKKIMQEEMRSYEETKEKMSSDLEKSETTCYVLKQEKERLLQDIAHMSSQVVAITTEIEAVKKTCTSCQEEKVKLEIENAALTDKLGKTTDSCDTSFSSLHCLQMAQKTLKERYSKIEQSYVDLQTDMSKKMKEYKQNIKELVRENEDLKERLSMGSSEYKTLYIENKKLQKKLGKVADKKKARKIERSTSESSVSSQTLVMETHQMSAAPEGDSREEMSKSSKLEKELENMGEELRRRQEKKNRYKKMYTEEKAKVEALRKHFHEEMHKKDEETDRLRRRIEEAASANESKVCSLEKFLSEKEKTIAQLEGKLRDTNIIHDRPGSSAEGALPKCSRPALGVNQPSFVQMPPSMVYPPVYYPLIYPHPTRQPPHACPRDGIVRPKEHKPLERLRYPGNEEVSSNPTVAGDSGSLSDPLKPLPAPLVPERLHTSKAAEVLSSLTSKDELETDAVVPTAPPVGQFEEKFEDAIGEGMKICPVCSESFSADIAAENFDTHVLGHVGKICPICQKLVENVNDSEFQYHVNKHLEDEDQETV